MIHPSSSIKAAGLGAGIMYFFDPEKGASRRAKIKDQLTQFQVKTVENAELIYHDATQRMADATSGLHTLADNIHSPSIEPLHDGITGFGRSLGIRSDQWTPANKTAVAIGAIALAAALLRKRDLAALALGAAGIMYTRKLIVQSLEVDQSNMSRSEDCESPERTAVSSF